MKALLFEIAESKSLNSSLQLLMFAGVFLIAGSLSAPDLLAHGSCRSHSHHAAINRSDLSDSEHARLEAGQAHHQLEPMSDGELGLRGRMIQWGRSFHPLHIHTNVVRTLRGSERKSYQAAMLDIIFIFSISHPLEMAAGSAMAATGFAMAWPAWLTALATGGGVLISIPGFDPGCLLLVGGYSVVKPRWLAKMLAPYRLAIRSGRILAVHVLKKSGELLFVPQIFDVIFERRNRLDVFQGLHREEIEGQQIKITPLNESGSWTLYFFDSDSAENQGLTSLELAVEKVQGRGAPFLKSLTMSLDSGWSFTDFERAIKGLGWNIKAAVLEILRLKAKEKISVLSERFYVESAHEESGFLKVHFKDSMIHLPTTLDFRRPISMLREGCRKVLAALAT